MRWYETAPRASHDESLILTLFTSSPDPSLIIRGDRFIECNQAAVEVLGYSCKDELLHVHPSDISPLYQADGTCSVDKSTAYIRQAEYEGTVQFEWIHQRKNGSHFTVRVTLSAMHSSSGPIIYVTWQDISETKAQHKSLQRSEARFQELFQSMPNGVLVLQPHESGTEFEVQSANPACEQIFHRSSYSLKGIPLRELLPYSRKKVDDLYSSIKKAWQGNTPHAHTFTVYKGHRLRLWLDIQIYKLSSGELVAILDDRTEKEQNRIRLELYTNVYRQSRQAVLISDQNNQIISVNEAFTELTGYREDEVRGHNPRILASGKVPPSTYQRMWHALQDNGYWQGELWDRTKDGRIYPKWITINTVRDKAGKISYYIASFSDITEQKNAEEQIQHLSYHDPLTHLLNRFSFEERLSQAISASQHEQRELAILFIDLDRFKDINDTLGHQVGDELLKAVAKRLKDTVKESDLLARLGGDEFTLAFTHFSNHNHLALKTSTLLETLSAPYEINDQPIYITPSIGVSVYPNDGDSVQELMKHADAAMYHAKSLGRKNFQFHCSTISEQTQHRLNLGQQLNQALQEEQFELYYQPQIDAASGNICALEALIRWHHPERGLVSPAEFIPVLEDSGLIEPVGEWVLRTACQQLAHWHQQGFAHLRMSVNLSARQLRSTSLISQVTAALAHCGLPASALELEITESLAMENPEQAISILGQLNAMGITIAIDDFGTGYSSLAYLKKLPIQILKLDREFVSHIETDSNDAAISTATISLAHSLGLKVVAEEVETQHQHNFLRQQGCDYLQGFFHGRPMPPAEIAAVLLERAEREKIIEEVET
ncbi:EAL domain-containing protein [Pontibacterium sp.]|uniref:sensor domain-containing protein n=1 Tax=Pontibacterium sp. TaxID=2036026 RepID=UPI00351341CE